MTVGPKASVWPCAVLRGDIAPIEVGEGTNIQDGAVVHVADGLPAKVGARVTVGHLAMIHACTIGDECLIGMHATILDGAVIGARSIVGANSLVTKGTQVPPGSLVMGSPAKVVRALTAEEQAEAARLGGEVREGRRPPSSLRLSVVACQSGRARVPWNGGPAAPRTRPVRIDSSTRAVESRAQKGERDPVEDFLFTYYPFRFAAVAPLDAGRRHRAGRGGRACRLTAASCEALMAFVRVALPDAAQAGRLDFSLRLCRAVATRPAFPRLLRPA